MIELRPTTVVHAPRLCGKTGVELVVVTESFQHTGSFKFRAALNLARKVDKDKLITASSGNFGQALAYACKLLGKKCIVVMPDDSSRVKVDAVREHGATVEAVDVRTTPRAVRLQQLAAEHPDAYIASAYDDPLVVEGNASLGREILNLPYSFDDILVPVGGGGLSAGIVTAVRQAGAAVKVTGCEPALANDAARSLKAGRLIASKKEAKTIADGARTLSLGKLNWSVLKDGLKRIIEVPEDDIKEAMRLYFMLANLKVEPTGALALGALIGNASDFRGRKVCLVVSGANVDPGLYFEILEPLAAGQANNLTTC